MDDKVQELASKIYRDGIAKADSRAAEIIAEAEQQRDTILSEAEAKARELLSRAESEAAERRDRAEKELKLAADRAADALRTEITDLVNARAVDAGISDAFADPQRLYDVVLGLAQKLFDEGSNSVVISTADAEAVKGYFMTKASDLLAKGLEVKSVQGQPAAFTIAPRDKGYEIEIGREALAEYFKEYMRPLLRETLFSAHAEEK